MIVKKLILKITDPAKGEAEYVDVPDDIKDKTSKGTHCSKHFRGFDTGQLIEAVFTFTEQDSIMVSDVKPIETAKKKEPVKVKKDNWWGNLYVSDEMANILLAVNSLSEKLGAANVLFVGPSGCGKTASAEALGSKVKKQVFRFDVSLIEDPNDWFFNRVIKDNSVVLVPTTFTIAVREGNAVVILDELNRIQPHIANSLFPLLDHARQTEVLNEKIVVGPNTVFAATANIGWQYTGTFVADAALLNRMDAVIKVDFLQKDIEIQVLEKRGNTHETAVSIASVLEEMRMKSIDAEIDVSTRSGIKVGNLVQAGLSIKDAFTYVLVNGAPEESQKNLLDIINKHTWK